DRNSDVAATAAEALVFMEYDDDGDGVLDGLPVLLRLMQGSDQANRAAYAAVENLALYSNWVPSLREHMLSYEPLIRFLWSSSGRGRVNRGILVTLEVLPVWSEVPGRPDVRISTVYQGQYENGRTTNTTFKEHAGLLPGMASRIDALRAAALKELLPPQ